MAGWSFYDLRRKIAYKAKARGIRVLSVDPAYTSQTCPVCGHISPSNRQSQSWFCCQCCGYQSNADRVGALNLAQRGRAALSGLHERSSVRVNQPNGVEHGTDSNASGVEAKADLSAGQVGTAAEPGRKLLTLSQE